MIEVYGATNFEGLHVLGIERHDLVIDVLRHMTSISGFLMLSVECALDSWP